MTTYLEPIEGQLLLSNPYQAACMGATTLSVYEIVGNSLCVASDDGRKVYDQIVAALRVGRKITLSFHDVTFLTAAFLHTAFGQLYGSFLEEDIRSNIQLTDIEP
ncbi:MAG: STAS-like domain-containing protein, partial [Deltaproteobacteria bacterium]|nr:STAS-like domain-containing protein [Deltaproteobacteria bacterium]